MSAIPAGYKQTEVGVIPEDWEVSLFADVAILERGKFSARPRNDPKYYGGGIPFIQTGDVTNSNGDITSFSQTLNEAGLKVSKLFPRDTLFFTIAANIGDVGFTSFDTACPDSLIAITPSRQIDKRWLYHELKSLKKVFEGLATQNAQLNINLEKLRPYALPVPPLPEQRAIAAALSDVDALLAKLDRFIAKKRDLKQAAMQQLLTGQTRLPGSSGAWEERTCSELVNGGDNIVDGPFGSNLKNSDFVSSGIPVLQGINISGDKFVWRDVRYVSEQKAKEVFRSNAAPGDLLTVKIGSVGFSALIEHLAGHDFAIIPANLLRLRFKAGSADARFVYYVLTSNKGKRALKDLAGNTAQPAIGLSGFRKLSFLVPLDIKEQAAIATVLSDMDAELAALEARRDKTRALKQGMMQELLTGRIRLI